MITFLAHMLDAERRGIPVQSVVHQVKNFTSEGPQIFRGVSNVAGTQTLDKVVENVLPHHMVLKHKDRGHSTMHPSVSQYVFMWCWRCSLDSPDLQRFLEELERLL